MPHWQIEHAQLAGGHNRHDTLHRVRAVRLLALRTLPLPDVQRDGRDALHRVHTASLLRSSGQVGISSWRGYTAKMCLEECQASQ